MPPRLVLAWTWTILILVLCWLPSWLLPEPEAIPGPTRMMHPDKLVHAGLFFIFATLWMGAYRSGRRIPRVLAAGLALAALSELGQGLEIVDRDPDLIDGLADAAGVVLGVLVARGPSRATADDHESARPDRRARSGPLVGRASSLMIGDGDRGPGRDGSSAPIEGAAERPGVVEE